METQLYKHGWFSPKNDVNLQKDFQKNCPLTSDIVAVAFFAFFFICMIYGTITSPKGQVRTPQKLFMTILMCAAIAVLCVWQGTKVFKKIYRVKHLDFYVKTCYLENFRVVKKTTGSRKSKNRHTYIYYYITVTDGYHVAEYKCSTNPQFSPQDITSHKEITLATLSDLKTDNRVSMVYVLDGVYPEYRG